MTDRLNWGFWAFCLAVLLASATPVHATSSVTVGISGSGAVRFTDANALACDATTEGSIRYVDASNYVQFCDDNAWVVLGPGGGGGSIDGLSDAVYDIGADHNMRIGSNTAMTAGAEQNLFIGEGAGTAGTTNAADYNVGVGYQALNALTTGASNVAVGALALSTNATGVSNTAVGDLAMEDNLWGANSTAVGSGVLQNNDGGAENVAVGSLAMRDSVSDDKNTMIGYGSGATAAQSNAVGLGYHTLYQSSGDNNLAVGYQAGNGITSGASNIVIGYDVDAMSATGNSQLNVGDTIYGDLANDRVRIGGSGTVAAGPLYAVPPATETIAAAAVITANACGTIKPIQSTGSVTTSTANTFTATTVAGCCMDVINVDAADTITLDANGAFRTIGGANQALGPDDSVRVCSNGTNWYQMGAVSANQ